MSVRYVPNAAGLAQLTWSPTGAVGRDMIKRGRRLEFYAKKQVGVKSGSLQRSIESHLVVTSTGLGVRVGSKNNIALAHHEGTRAHRITPKRSNALRFVHHGRIVYARQVWHPGTRPNKYLTDNLPRVVLT